MLNNVTGITSQLVSVAALKINSSKGWRNKMTGPRHDGSDSELTPEKIVGIVIMSVLNVFMLLGNIVSIVTITKTPSLRNETYYWFVFNLAIVDLLNSMTVVPINIVWEAHGTWPFNQAFCNIIIFLDIAFSAIASYSTTLVSLDKFVRITRPYLYHSNRVSVVVITSVVAVWTIWLTFSAVSVFGGIARDTFYESKLTYIVDPCNFIMTDNYAIASAIVSFFIPLIIIVFTSIRIVCVARKHISKIAANRPSITIDTSSTNERLQPRKGTDASLLSIIASKKLQQKANISHLGEISQSVATGSTGSKRLSKAHNPSRKSFAVCRAFSTVMIVTVFFILMFAPYWFASIVEVGCRCIPPYVFEDYLTVFYYMHSLVNPYIYMATDKRYKKAISKLYRKYFRRNEIDTAHRTSLSKDEM